MRWVKGQVCVVHTAGGETGCFPPLPCGPDAGDEEGTSLRGIEAGCFSKCIHAHCYFWLSGQSRDACRASDWVLKPLCVCVCVYCWGAALTPKG